jgi:serine/threonine protein kinase
VVCYSLDQTRPRAVTLLLGGSTQNGQAESPPPAGYVWSHRCPPREPTVSSSLARPSRAIPNPGTRSAQDALMMQMVPQKVAVAEDTYHAGDVVAGKYRLDWEASEGGMCRVWMAVNTTLDLPVAIKFLHRELRCSALVDCLQREARAMAALHHPAVVRVFDWGQISPDNPFIVMERLDGDDLRQTLDSEGPLSAEDAVRLMLPIASGLCAAHAHGIVHRDLKPENILLARDDGGRIQPKLLDFGIARVSSEDRSRAVSEIHAIGTVGYMPPEQVFALEGLDHRADVWAFCAVLYEIISGETPVSGESLDDMRRAFIQDTIPSLADSSGVEEALWALLERGLRKDPNERWSTMHELGRALGQWLVSRGILDDVFGCSIAAEWFDRSAPDAVAKRTGPDDASAQPTRHPSASTTLPFSVIRTKGRAIDGWALMRALARSAQAPRRLEAPSAHV